MRKTLTFGVFILSIAIAGSFLGLASAQEVEGPQASTAVLLADDFTFSGALTSNGWTAHSGGGTNPISTTTPGLTYSGYVGSGVGNAAGIVASGEDVHRTFAVQNSGTVYAAVLVNFSDATVDPLGGYFFHLGPDPISTTFRGRVFVKKDGSNNLAFGISKAGNAAAGDIAFTPFNYAMNTTHLLVVKYSIIAGATNDTIDLFVNPVLGGAEPAANVTAPDVGAGDIDPASVAIRQGEASRGPVGSVDGVRVATSWSDLSSGGAAPTSPLRLFKAHLNGAKEVPPNNSTATGFGRVALNEAQNQITVSVYYSRLSSGTTMGHIHGPAAAGANAGILFDLMPQTGQTTGSVTNMTFNVTPAQVADLRAGLWYFNIHTTNFPDGEIRGQILRPAAPSDFNGDGKTDYSIVRGGPGGASGTLTWWTNFNGSNQVKIDSFGFNSDYILPADFDGDGADDIAIWRSTGTAGFWVLRSSDGAATFTAFGQEGDDPAIIADYTGDGVDDFAVYRPGATANAPSQFWYLARSGIYSGLQVVVQWGLQTDLAIIGDYDGNGLADFTVVRPIGASGNINEVYTLANMPDGTIGNVSIRQFGFSTDFFTPGDWDGDGITDLAISRAVGSNILWIYRPSSGGGDVWTQWGRSATDFEAPGDYDGDGRTDHAIWRQSNTPGSSTFIVKFSSGGVKYHPWGLAGDVLTFWEVK
jgi:hypothetical protein